MRVTVRVFARLRDVIGTGEFTADVAEGATVAAVWTAVVAAHPDAAAYARAVSCAVNADYARMTTPVREGDEVAFLPPVSGGASDR